MLKLKLVICSFHLILTQEGYMRLKLDPCGTYYELHNHILNSQSIP